MKCRKPNTDQECNLTVLVNGQPCAEYILPSQTDFASNAGDILECFVGLSEGDEVTLTGYFRGSVLHASFDLLADGSFVADKRIEGLKTGELKYYSQRKLDYSTVMHVPKEEGWTSIFEPTKVVEGRLGVKALPQTDAKVQRIASVMKADGYKISLGTIAVVVSLNQDGNENYSNDYADMRCGEWRNRDNREATNGGIRASHELEVRFTDDLINTNKQSKHRRHFEQTRFGKKPWATFVFYYRSLADIRQAGCVARPDRWQGLIDAGENYVQVDPTPKKPQRPIIHNMNSQQQQGPASVDPVVACPVKLQEPLKAKLFGQSLFSQAPKPGALRESPDTLFVAPTDEEEEKKRGSRQTTSPLYSPSCTDSLDDEKDATNALKQIASGAEVQARRSANSLQIPKTGTHGLSNGGAYDSQHRNVNGTSGNSVNGNPSSLRDSAAPVAISVASADSSQGTALVQSYLEDSNNFEDGALPANETRRVPSHDEIRALASQDGEIPVNTLFDYFHAQGIDHNTGIKVAGEVAYRPNASGPWYLKNPSRGFEIDGNYYWYHPIARQCESLPEVANKDDGDVHPENVAPMAPAMGRTLEDDAILPSIEGGEAPAQAEASAAPTTAEEMKVKTEPGSTSSIAGLHPSNNIVPSSTAAMAPPPIPTMGMKRPTSTRSPTASRENTPSKRARSATVELRELVAAMKMQKEKMLQRKAELQKKAEEKKAQREKERREEEERIEREKREEEELLRELEEMRKENMALEDELEAEEKRLEAGEVDGGESLEHE